MGLASDKTIGKAVVLLSGGIDSSTSAAVTLREGYAVHALTFDYGQRHRYELAAAREVAKSLGIVDHKVISVDLRQIGGSALTDNIRVPKGRLTKEMSASIPITYVPARNLILLSLAVAWAEVIEAETIVIGANAVDYSGYPDCRPEFIQSFETTANLATRQGSTGKQISVKAPLIAMAKAEIIKTGIRLGLDYSLTSSCYDPTPDGLACRACDSCLIRAKGFSEAGVADPTRYVATTGEKG
jgi:7-cyano-7-deazaguanine synthase